DRRRLQLLEHLLRTIAAGAQGERDVVNHVALEAGGLRIAQQRLEADLVQHSERVADLLARIPQLETSLCQIAAVRREHGALPRAHRVLQVAQEKLLAPIEL